MGKKQSFQSCLPRLDKGEVISSGFSKRGLDGKEY